VAGTAAAVGRAWLHGCVEGPGSYWQAGCHHAASPRRPSIARHPCQAGHSQGAGLDPANGTVVAGPLAWPVLRLYASHIPPTTFDNEWWAAPAIKSLIALKTGAVVRVSIPAAERTRLSLYYVANDPRGDVHGYLGYRVSDGESDVTFRACRGPKWPSHTGFAGYFIVAGAQCAEVDVYTGTGGSPCDAISRSGSPRGPARAPAELVAGSGVYPLPVGLAANAWQ